MKNIIVIGGGASGILSIKELVEKLDKISDTKITLIEKEKILGGVAYNLAALPGTVLNTQIRTMSAFAEQPDDLLEWLNSSQTDKSNWPKEYKENKWDGSEFCPRILYGFYLRSIFEKTKTLAKEKNIEIEVLEDCATDIQILNKHMVNLSLESGKQVLGESVVLCIGQLNAAQLPVYQKIEHDPQFINELWSAEGINKLNNISAEEDILVIGTGLTANDVVFKRKEMLDAATKKKSEKIGHTYLVSRHACMHIPFPTDYKGWTAHEISVDMPQTFNDIHELKCHIKKTASNLLQQGLHPEEIYRNIMRKLVPIWQSIPINERLAIYKKYKHLDIFRTGISKFVMDCVTDMQTHQKLTIYAADILSINKNADSFDVTLLTKNKNNIDGHKYREEKTINVKSIINASGFDLDIQKSSLPLLRNLRDKGISVNYLGLGFDCTATGQLYDKNKSLLPIFCVGALSGGYAFDHNGKLGSTRSMAGIRRQAPSVIKGLSEFLKDTDCSFDKKYEDDKSYATSVPLFGIFSPPKQTDPSNSMPANTIAYSKS